jgi:hypothetical protein
MTTFLFWNLNGKPLEATVARLALRYEVDVLLLVECSIAPDILLGTLNQGDRPEYHYAPGYGCEKVAIFTRFPGQFILPTYEEERLTIRHLNLPGVSDILLAVTHLPSKTHWSSASLASWCAELSRSIRIAENEAGHSRTVLVGDLNMNPFEDGVVSANGLHGVMCRRIAARKERVVQGKKYPFFYNPMWGLFGGATSAPPGTYYYRSSEPVAFFWNMFDQVLIRPDLTPLFSHQDLKILTSDGSISLLSPRGLPDDKIASDHLPIFFRIML